MGDINNTQAHALTSAMLRGLMKPKCQYAFTIKYCFWEWTQKK